MTNKITAAVAAVTLAAAANSAFATPPCNSCGGGTKPTTPAQPANPGGSVSGTGTGTGIGTGIGSGVGKADADAAGIGIGGGAKVGDTTADAKSELNGKVEGVQAQTFQGKNGDVTVDNSDNGVTKVTTPVHVEKVAGSFLIPPQIMQLCQKFNAKDNGGWGVGVQYKDQSYGFHYKGKTTSEVKPEMDCVNAINNHAARMQNLQFQHEISMRAASEGVEVSKLIAATGTPGQMVVVQKYFANEAEAVAKPGSAVRSLFGFTADKPAAKPVVQKKVVRKPVKACNCK